MCSFLYLWIQSLKNDTLRQNFLISENPSVSTLENTAPLGTSKWHLDYVVSGKPRWMIFEVIQVNCDYTKRTSFTGTTRMHTGTAHIGTWHALHHPPLISTQYICVEITQRGWQTTCTIHNATNFNPQQINSLFLVFLNTTNSIILCVFPQHSRIALFRTHCSYCYKCLTLVGNFQVSRSLLFMQCSSCFLAAGLRASGRSWLTHFFDRQLGLKIFNFGIHLHWTTNDTAIHLQNIFDSSLLSFDWSTNKNHQKHTLPSQPLLKLPRITTEDPPYFQTTSTCLQM